MLKGSSRRDIVKAASGLAKFAPPALRGDRLADADRERAIDRLNDALVEGRITIEEFEERFDAVQAAAYDIDLRLPMAGLPADELARAGGRSADALVLRAGAGGLKRNGAWTVPARLHVKSGLGSIELDFSETEIPHRVVQIELKLGAGSAQILLPADATANVDGLVASAGAITSKVSSQAAKGVPHFVVCGRTRFGSVIVRRPRRFGGLRF